MDILNIGIVVGWSVFWIFRFKHALPDSDYGQFAYYGFFANKKNNYHLITDLPVYIGFKPGGFYMMYLAYLICSKWNSPRYLFVIWNSAAAYLLLETIQKPDVVILILVLTLSLAPCLGSLFNQGEFWGLLPTSLMLFLSFSSDFPGRSELFGILLFVNPLLFKLTYIFESIVLLIFFNGSPLHVFFGVSILGTTLFLLFSKTQILKGTIYSITHQNILNYFLRYGRDHFFDFKALFVFKNVIYILLFPLVVLIWYGDVFIITLLISQLVAIILQMRFYRYHFVVLIPSIVLLAGKADFYFVCIATIPPLVSFIVFLLMENDEKIDSIINKKIPHYHKRSVASKKVATWLREHTYETDLILTVGDTPQLHVLSGRMSPNYYLDFDPNAAEAASHLQDRLMIEVINNPPQYIVMMMNCLNWSYFNRRTGLFYEKCHSIEIGDETFSIFKLTDNKSQNDRITGKLFLPCRFVSDDGKKIWNKTGVDYEL